jgi:hypothetical protein
MLHGFHPLGHDYVATALCSPMLGIHHAVGFICAVSGHNFRCTHVRMQNVSAACVCVRRQLAAVGFESPLLSPLSLPFLSPGTLCPRPTLQEGAQPDTKDKPMSLLSSDRISRQGLPLSRLYARYWGGDGAALYLLVFLCGLIGRFLG